jgi:predicted TIM-barrel fold metal-dependent hydrolase
MATPLRTCRLAAIAVLIATRVLAQSEGVPRPVADHHAHLQSIAVWQLFNKRLPVVKLPGELDQLLRDFERNWQAPDNKTALAAQFTDSGLFQYADDWLRGRAAIRMMLVGSGGALKLRAQTFDTDQRSGHVGGAYGFYRDTVWVDQGRFLFALRREPGTPWRIAVANLTRTTPSPTPARDPYSAADYVAALDSAGIRRGVVLSWAYQIAAGFRDVTDEAAKVRAENDWTAREAARYPDRLVAFCSLNPLRAYALDELANCARDPRIRGLKLHLTTAFFDFRDAEHVRRLAAVFATANARRFPIVVHMRTMNPEYGRRDAEIFLSQVLPKAPDVPIQIAHLAGWGGYGAETDAALSVFAEAFASGDRRVTNVYFDLSGLTGVSPSTAERVVQQIRRIGIDRMLFGIDRVGTPGQAWESLTRFPFTRDELARIATNLAPWLRPQADR